MNFFDDIVPSEIASGGYRPLRITVRPKGVELPQPDVMSADVGFAPNQVEPGSSEDSRQVAPSPRRGLFDDIVLPAVAAASTSPRQKGIPRQLLPLLPQATGLFDDIVPPAEAAAETSLRENGTPKRMVPLSSQSTGPIAASAEDDIPYYDPMTGIPMMAPHLAPQSPGLPVRPETQAPLDTPSSDWPDLPVMAPRFGVPLAVPDPNARGEGFPAPPGPTAMDRIKAAAARGFGEGAIGFSEENRAKYPHTFRTWQPVAAPLDFAMRAPGAAIGAISSAGSEIYKVLGGTESNANRLERDLNIIGQGAIVEGGIGGRYNVAKPQATWRATEGALRDEAAAAREAINPTVPAPTPRQILAEASEQGVPISRAGPQPPARPPDRAAAQSDRMIEARASGPFSLEGRDQHAPTAIASAATSSIPAATAAASGPRRIGSFTPRADLKYSGTDFGIHAHQEVGSMLQELYRGADLILRVKRGEKGIDVSVPGQHIARLGFAHAEIKPLSASGEKKMRQQILKWEYDPSTVQAITYDANGNVYFGFR